MTKDIAKLLMNTLLLLDDPLQKATEITDQIDDENERKMMRRGVGEIGLKIYEDLMVPIIKQYPDLNPEKD